MTQADSRGPVTTLDLKFFVEGTVGAFLVRTSAGPVLVETGPESCFEGLRAAVEAQGFALEDVREVFLTHVHLDHGGAAWRLARHGARIHMHPAGVRHLVDPAKLLASARRVYGDKLEMLWGRLEAIPEDRIVPLEDGAKVRVGDATFEAIHTPGHASHHITYRLEDGLFTGDVGGVRLGDGPVIPPFPPPDIDLEAWRDSIARMRAARPEALYPTHFGVKRDAGAHLDALEANLERIALWMRARLAEEGDEAALVPPFEAYIHDLLVEAALPEETIRHYEIADPAYMSVHGLARYWRKKAGA